MFYARKEKFVPKDDFKIQIVCLTKIILNNEGAKREYGFIAQELEEALNTSGASGNGIISKDDEGMYGVRYNDLLAPMVKAMQELSAKDEAQQKLIEFLHKRIEELEKTK